MTDEDFQRARVEELLHARELVAWLSTLFPGGDFFSVEYPSENEWCVEAHYRPAGWGHAKVWAWYFTFDGSPDFWNHIDIHNKVMASGRRDEPDVQGESHV